MPSVVEFRLATGGDRMAKYTVKRFLFIIPMMLGVILLVFSMINLVPGDPGRTILGITATQEAVDKLNEELGYNRPFLLKLFDYLRGVILRFDFGTSYVSGEATIKLIMTNFEYTFRLAVLCTLSSTLVGIPLGIYAAVKQYSPADNVLRITAMCLNSVPGFWIMLLAILLFCLYLGWLPSHGVDSWRNYVLPVGINALTAGASLMRMTRTIMLETIRQDYVRTARAKGCSERTVNWRHAFLNASLPIITSIGLSFGVMLGGTVIMEDVFSMPGLGGVAMKAVSTKDLPVVMGCTIFLAAIFCVIVVIVDLIGAWVDPRVRAKFSRS
jgi:peptide/nickel transport system permease protein